MEKIIRNISEFDRQSHSKFKFRHLDKFGTMLNFHIKGVSRYQTPIGSIFTLSFYLLVVLAFFYYVSKFIDDSEPLVIMSNFNVKDALSVDILKAIHIPYFEMVNQRLA